MWGIYKGLIKVMATVRYFWHGFIHRGLTFMYLQDIRAPLIYHISPDFWKTSYTISAFIIVDVPYWPPYITDLSLVLNLVPRSGSSTLAKISYSHGFRRKRLRLVAQNPILHDNARSHTAAVTDLLRCWQWEILEHPPYSPDMSPCDYDLFTKVEEQHKRETLPYCRAALNSKYIKRLFSQLYYMDTEHGLLLWGKRKGCKYLRIKF